MSKKISVYDLWSQKGKRKWAQTHIDTDKEAEAAFKAGIEIISCEPDHYLRGQLETCDVQYDIPFANIKS